MSFDCSLVIGIPTFRRPDGLKALLHSLHGELEGVNALVLVADNDCGDQAPTVVDSCRGLFANILCLPVKARGVAQVRNSLVGSANELAPGWQWLLMFDDDGLVRPGVVKGLVSTGDLYQAHVVGGVVDGGALSNANILARHSLFAARRKWETGVVPMLNGAQNIAISRRIFDFVEAPLFRNEYGASGGEDYDFFRRIVSAGGRLAWSADAVVFEPPTSAQVTVKGLLNRYFTTGAYMVLIDRFYDGSKVVWIRALKGLVTGVGRTLWGGLTLNGSVFANGVLSTAHFLGRLAGLFGARTSRYVNTKEGK